jgi:hypothetical protein
MQNLGWMLGEGQMAGPVKRSDRTPELPPLSGARDGDSSQPLIYSGL